MFQPIEPGSALSTIYGGLPQAWRRSARLAGASFLLALAAGAAGVSFQGGISLGGRWLVPAAAAAAWILHRFLRLLPLNRPEAGGAVYGDLGPATRITLLRGILVALLAGFAFIPWPRMGRGPVPWPWVPGMLYGLAVILDGLDGWVARKTGRVTRMGARLDMETDALGLLVASGVAVLADRLPPAYLTAGLAYYLFSAGIRVRERLGRPVGEVLPWQGARIIAGWQMALAAAALLPVVSTRAASLAAYIVMIPLLAGFGRDWWIVCGRAGNDCFARTPWGRWMHGLALRWIPLSARLFALAWAAAWLAGPALPVHRHGAVLAAALAMMALGFLGRTAAAVSVWIAGGLLAAGGQERWAVSAAFVSGLAVVMAGTGPLSLWRPEDRWVAREAGDRQP